ncbi:HAD-like superfamily [Arabidopsis suecica]|uniref:HAD-like superfamily n=1 Tax=Arabidopsis suecica TaxID=45249 RepID=A0A8T1ZXF3_ARASU|nr:HAD-like superfamily [Arabidopsis suecica]
MATVKISLSLASLSPSSSSSSSSTQSKLSPSFIPNAAPAKAAKLRFHGKCLRAKPMVHRGSRSGGITCSASSSPTSTLPSALLFDCDGVLVDTEKDGHRISFNDTFKERELDVTWDVDLYGELLKIGGGKERMTAYFNKVGWPEKAPKDEAERKEFIAGLHKQKTELFMVLIEKKLLPLRPGVAKLVDQALTNGVKVAVCSTSNEKAVSAIVSCLLGPERAENIKIFAGDVVPKKKPDPAIYNLAAETLGVDPSKCVVVEDSAIGLAAAKAAGMTCIVTKSGYTADEDFENADAVFDCIGDPPEERFDLAFCGSLLQKQFVS